MKSSTNARMPSHGFNRWRARSANTKSSTTRSDHIRLSGTRRPTNISTKQDRRQHDICNASTERVQLRLDVSVP